jgi:hypothetical protein
MDRRLLIDIAIRMVPRGGVPWASKINAVRWQTAARGSFDPQRVSGAMANHQPMPPIFPHRSSSDANGQSGRTVLAPKEFEHLDAALCVVRGHQVR